MRAEGGSAPIGWGTVGIAAAVSLALAAALVWLARSHAGVPVFTYTSDLVFAVVWTAAGLLAWRLRPVSRSGPLMLGLGAALFVNAPFGWALPTDLPLRELVTAAGAAGYWLILVLAGYLLLTYPSGRFVNAGERRFIQVACGSAAVAWLGQLLFMTPDPTGCLDRCPVSPIQVVESHRLSVAWFSSAQAWFALLAVICVAYLVRRFATGGRRWRRQRAVVLVASAALIVGAGSSLALSAWDGSVERFGWMFYPLGYLSLVTIPVAFLVGLLRDRVGYVSVADLVRGLDQVRPQDLQAELARTLQDPDLQILFPIGEQGDFVDSQGLWVSAEADTGRELTLLGPPGAPVAALLHDPSLSESPKLLQAAGAAARLALENARLQAEVRAQLAEVRASRARIVAAADDERERLERNLHDGAQQRLLGIGMTLQMLRAGLDDRNAASEYLDEAEQELRSAIQELRELAQGIYPAVLTDEGLLAGVGMLARRSPIAVKVDGQLSMRPPAALEAAAYYIVSEALQNVTKHADATVAVVSVRQDDRTLEIVISDDGVGGASLDRGSGLRGLADRAMALDGSFDVVSQPGRGTEVRVRLPCE